MDRSAILSSDSSDDAVPATPEGKIPVRPKGGSSSGLVVVSSSTPASEEEEVGSSEGSDDSEDEVIQVSSSSDDEEKFHTAQRNTSNKSWQERRNHVLQSSSSSSEAEEDATPPKNSAQYRKKKPILRDSSSSKSSSDVEGGSVGFLEAEDKLSKLMDETLIVSPASPKKTITPPTKDTNQPKITDVLKPKDQSSETKRRPSSPPEIQILSEVPAPPQKKHYSPSQVQELESKIKKQEMAIEKNNRLLKGSLTLPDNGVKLKAFISKLESEKAAMERELIVGKENIGTSGPGDSESVTDAQKVQLLRNKLSILKQKYATTRTGDTEQGAHLVKEISKTQRELLKCTESAGKGSTAMGDLGGNTQEKSAWQKIREEGLDLMNNVTWNQWAQGPAANQLYGGRMNQARKMEVISVTQEAIKKLHDSLEGMPVEADTEADPLLLKKSVSLFPHQRQALAWLLWRETQDPPGGILADDMGLGKTLTMISLILKSREIRSGSEDKEEWLDTKEGKGLVRSQGTLIVCPSSLMSQWEGEVRKRLKSDALDVLIYHGTGRGQSARSLARHDLVITTYHTVMNDLKGVLGGESAGSSKLEDIGAVREEGKSGGNVQLLKVAWERIILDEAHQIRNPKSKTAQAACRLRGAHRWCVTGTPIQNKELDMYSLIRFLRCAPFDEYRVWKTWVDNRTSQGQTRMNTLIKSLLLRRTKEQKSAATGDAIVNLPDKKVLDHSIKLSEEEQKVYDKVFSLSQSAMINYMKKYHEEKGESVDVGSRYGSKPDYSYKPPGSGPKDVKAHHLLVLLLRLRQICCHPSLIHSMLDQEVKSTEGIEDEAGDELDLISRMEDMSLAKNKDGEEENLLISSNPVFDTNKASSKIVKLVSALEEISGKGEKAVIVSQWTSMLGIVERYVSSVGLSSVAINGQVPVRARGDIVESFNSPSAGSPRVMLLSLGAGGVGLNLTGGNHLFLLDMHWNPQLESQACDRIYRVGQTRPVTIHKFLTEDTVESRIHLLQQKKINLANGVLTGAKRTGANKLSFEDLKMLFNVK